MDASSFLEGRSKWLVLAGSVAVVWALLWFAFSGGRDPLVSVADIERCERGLVLASSQTSVDEAMATYYRECSVVYAEPACRDAFVKAAETPRQNQSKLVFEACSKAYCPVLADRKLTACRSDFDATPQALLFAWPQLDDAILRRDTGDYADRIHDARVRLAMRAFQAYAAQGSAAPTEDAAAALRALAAAMAEGGVDSAAALAPDAAASEATAAVEAAAPAPGGSAAR